MGSEGAALSGRGLIARSGPSTPRTEKEELVRLISREAPFSLSSYRCTAWERVDKGPAERGKRIKCSDERGGGVGKRVDKKQLGLAMRGAMGAGRTEY